MHEYYGFRGCRYPLICMASVVQLAIPSFSIKYHNTIQILQPHLLCADMYGGQNCMRGMQSGDILVTIHFTKDLLHSKCCYDSVTIINPRSACKSRDEGLQ